jgi:hypothetical protein
MATFGVPASWYGFHPDTRSYSTSNRQEIQSAVLYTTAFERDFLEGSREDTIHPLGSIPTQGPLCARCSAAVERVAADYHVGRVVSASASTTVLPPLSAWADTLPSMSVPDSELPVVQESSPGLSPALRSLMV